MSILLKTILDEVINIINFIKSQPFEYTSF